MSEGFIIREERPFPVKFKEGTLPTATDFRFAASLTGYIRRTRRMERILKSFSQPRRREDADANAGSHEKGRND